MNAGRDGRRGARAALARLLRCTAGVSATEFALLAPVLVLGAFATADAGMAIYEKMMIGQALRAGAQSAMAGADEERVRAVLDEVAAENFALAGDGQAASGVLSIGVSIYCACAGETFVQVDCTAVCGSGVGTSRFYRLTAAKTFDGVILPAFGLDSSIDVAAR